MGIECSQPLVTIICYCPLSLISLKYSMLLDTMLYFILYKQGGDIN